MINPPPLLFLLSSTPALTVGCCYGFFPPSPAPLLLYYLVVCCADRTKTEKKKKGRGEGHAFLLHSQFFPPAILVVLVLVLVSSAIPPRQWQILSRSSQYSYWYEKWLGSLEMEGSTMMTTVTYYPKHSWDHKVVFSLCRPFYAINLLQKGCNGVVCHYLCWLNQERRGLVENNRAKRGVRRKSLGHPGPPSFSYTEYTLF